MPADYHHGVRVIEVNNGTRPIRTVSTAIIGMVCTADDADATYYPLNTPVLIAGDFVGAISKAGATGTLKASLEAIQKQCEPVVVVVRVDADADTTIQTANIVGSATGGVYTGLQALKAAQATLGIKPRILGVPGFNSQVITSALITLAQTLRAFVYAGVPAATVADAIIYRENFGAREAMLIWPVFNAIDTIAAALGLRAKIDQEVGWHKTISNYEVNGPTGITPPVFFDLQNSNTEAGLLNASDVTCLVRMDGFRYWGNRTASSDPLFAFENYTRTAHVLADTIADAHAWAIDKPMTSSLVKDIIEGVNAKFRQLKALGYIIDATAWYDSNVNTETTLKDGKLYIDYDYTPVPPLENLTFTQRITDRYLVDFAKTLSA